MNKRKKYISSAKPYFSKSDVSFILKNLPEILNRQLTMGKWVNLFEDCVKEMAGTKYALATHSCTSALEIALKSLNIGKGDEVLVPVQTFIATANAVINVGGTPVFCDINPKTHCLLPEDAEKRITKKTKAVILVHYGGLITPEIDKIENICKKYNLFLIEDAAHSHGASKAGRKAGSIGVFGCFSYYATKVLTSGGEGGALTTNDENLFEIARCYQFRGQDIKIDEEQIFVRVGHNVRMTEFQALCAVVQHKHLEKFLKKRNIVAKKYDSFIEEYMPEVEVIKTPKDTVCSYWKYTVNLPKDVSRILLQKEMMEKYKIVVNWSYYPPIHLQPVFRKLYKTYDGMLPNAEDICERHINLPMHVCLNEKDLDYILESFNKCFNSLRNSRNLKTEDKSWYLKRINL